MTRFQQLDRSRPLLTEQEVADIFGVTDRTVRRWAHAGDLTPVRMGGITRYRTNEIARLVDGEEVTDEETPEPGRTREPSRP